MSDFKVSRFEWTRLQRSANCFVPALVDIIADLGDELTNKRIAEAAADSDKSISEHIVGRIVNLVPVRHGRADLVIAGYMKLQAQRPEYPSLSGKNIVAAVLVVPNLAAMMDRAGLDVQALSERARVSDSAINYALGGGRVSAGIVCALYVALGGASQMPPLDQFAVSNHRLGNLPIAQQNDQWPLRYSDLTLPINLEIPIPWP